MNGVAEYKVRLDDGELHDMDPGIAILMIVGAIPWSAVEKVEA